jgi:hypothetical protein
MNKYSDTFSGEENIQQPVDRVFYIRDFQNRPIVALAISYKDSQHGKAHVGFSIWNGTDKFNKAIGRTVALGRAKSVNNSDSKTNKQYSFVISRGKNSYDDMLSAMNGLLLFIHKGSVPSKIMPYLVERIRAYEAYTKS